jgi:hypothetical protein
VRNLQIYLNPQAEHLLDWFHLKMGLTVLSQTAKGLPERLGAISSNQAALSPSTVRAVKEESWQIKNMYRILYFSVFGAGSSGLPLQPEHF